VLLERGYVPIKKIVLGDRVLVYGLLDKNMNYKLYDNSKYEDVVFVGYMQTHSNLCTLYYKENIISEGVPNKDFYPTAMTRVLNYDTKVYEMVCNSKLTVHGFFNEPGVYHIMTKEHSMIKINGVLTETLDPVDIVRMSNVFPINFSKFIIKEKSVINVKRRINNVLVDLEILINDAEKGDYVIVEEYIDNRNERKKMKQLPEAFNKGYCIINIEKINEDYLVKICVRSLKSMEEIIEIEFKYDEKSKEEKNYKNPKTQAYYLPSEKLMSQGILCK
jgi:hypothetical protein